MWPLLTYQVHMMLKGKMAELLVKINPKLYRKYLMMKKCKPIMYVQLKKVLYGTLLAALLFWKNLSKKLIAWGFVINPYNWCIANKIIDGKQRTAYGTLMTSKYHMLTLLSLKACLSYSKVNTERKHR
jgi:hypothetical protein